MIKKLTCLSLVLTVVFAPCGIVAAEQEQWLGYRSSAEAAKIVGKTPGQNLELTSERPQGVSLPEFVGEGQLFGKWKTPMVPAGFLWLAIDKNRNSSLYGQLFIDSDADGSLADETAVLAHKAKTRGDRQTASFRQAKVLLGGKDGPTAFHLDMQCSTK